jgi:YD repeat-containing protein
VVTVSLRDRLPDGDTAAIPGCIIDASLTLGRVVSVSDRGAKTATAYDGRGRTICVGRRMATPTPSDTLEARYTPTWNVQSVAFDGADRPVQTTTGVDVAELFDKNSQSVVTTAYSKRGTISSVVSGYGALVTGVTRAADGLIAQITYGDVAATTSTFTYDSRRRLFAVQTLRGPPPIWSANPPAYQPAPTPSGLPSTFQLVLENATYLYDAVDNPTEIHDYRNAAEWPGGAQPVTRKVQYDDLYRVTNVAYEYPNGTDGWVDPFYAEDNGIHPDSRRGTPSPHVSFQNRVLSESFKYDWLGNTIQTDDDAHGFYDRSLGTVTNGTAAQGPYQLTEAQQAAASPRGGSLSTTYDDAGNLIGLSLTRDGPCLPTGATCSQQFVYDWDEVGRLVRARRWDQANALSVSEPPSVELVYGYDSSDQRTLKTAVDSRDNETNDVAPSNFAEPPLLEVTTSDRRLRRWATFPPMVSGSLVCTTFLRASRNCQAWDRSMCCWKCPTISALQASSWTRRPAKLSSGRLIGQEGNPTAIIVPHVGRHFGKIIGSQARKRISKLGWYILAIDTLCPGSGDGRSRTRSPCIC